MLDVFCGQGALLLALAEEGVQVDRFYAMDNDPIAGLMLMETVEYILQHPELSQFVSWNAVAHMWDTWGDVSETRDADSDISRLLASDDLGRIDVTSAGPPCQPFSRADPNARGWEDPRAQLFVDAADLQKRLVEKGEQDGHAVACLLKNVVASPRLSGCKQQQDDIVGVEGVTWDSGQLVASTRKRVWWSNDLAFAAPVADAPREQSLAEALIACGGQHRPRIATTTDRFNTAGEPVVVTATVMASWFTKSNIMPPRGTGTGCHLFRDTDYRDPLDVTERFAVMSWPPEIASRAMRRGIPILRICSSIGNSMCVRAVRH